MRSIFGIVLLAFVLVALPGCDSPERRVAKARSLLEAYQSSPDDASQAEVERVLDDLEATIAKLHEKGDPRASDLAQQTHILRSDFQSAKLARAFKDARQAMESMGKAFHDTMKSIHDAVRPAPTPQDP